MATKSTSSKKTSNASNSYGLSSKQISSLGKLDTSKIQTFGNTNNMNSTSAPKMTTTTGVGGYADTAFKNANGSTTSIANKPQYGTSGTVKNSDGSSTVYKGGGYSTFDANGHTTGGGLYGTENWGASGGNLADLPGYSSGGGGGGGSSSSSYVPQASVAQPTVDYASVYNDSLTKLQSDYTAKLDAFQRMMQTQQTDYQTKYDQQQSKYDKQYSDLLNKFNYNANQQQMGASMNTPARDGIHLFNPGGTQQTPDATVATSNGYTQNGSSNEVLNRYLQNIWKGGF